VRLAGRTAIVTGAASGIGRAIALAFAAERASIVIADMRTSPGLSCLPGGWPQAAGATPSAGSPRAILRGST
jgi:NAD(P)-dependent dehydrogenase (short-subunit alcohol dehydrogenase family)